MQIYKLLLAVLSCVALVAALPVSIGASSGLAQRTSDISTRSLSMDEPTALLARAFGEDEDAYLERRDDCIICLEANAKHTNCPNGQAHPAHVQCLIDWQNTQYTQGHAPTCPACRAPTSPLIKQVKGKPAAKGKGKRDLEEVEEAPVARSFDEGDFSGLEARDDCIICLEANAKHTNCPNGQAHPAHVQCLIDWQNTQYTQGHAPTCPACRAPTSPLIKQVKGKPAPKGRGKRDLEAVEEDFVSRSIDEEDFSGLEARDDCIICLEANAKHTNCPNGQAHPAHVQCLIDWQNTQYTQGHAPTCPACRAPTSPLIKQVKGKPAPKGRGKRDLEAVEEASVARSFDDEELSGLEARDDCIICLEANAKHTNCPNGQAHPAHVQCLIDWQNTQYTQGHAPTCPACRAPTSPLIKQVKGKPAPKGKGKRDLEEVEEAPVARSFDEEDFSGLEARDDCIICLEANAKHTNCPNGQAHPAHVQCLIDWQNTQYTQGHAPTCPACRAPTSPLIKQVKGKPAAKGKGKRDLEVFEEPLSN